MVGRYCIGICVGIHRPVVNVLVVALQSDGRLPSLKMFIKAVEEVLSIFTSQAFRDDAIFLATDGDEAVGTLAFLWLRVDLSGNNVQRTTSDAGEVDFSD